MVDEIAGPPPNYVTLGWSDTVYSNYDHELDAPLVERMRAEPVCAGHAAWDFHGTVWFEPEPALWHELVKRHHVAVAHLTGADVMDVIRQANEQFGND